jgi:hypothetical protein
MNRGLLSRLKRLEGHRGLNDPQIGFECHNLQADGSPIRCRDFEVPQGNPVIRVLFVEAGEGRSIGWTFERRQLPIFCRGSSRIRASVAGSS